MNSSPTPACKLKRTGAALALALVITALSALLLAGCNQTSSSAESKEQAPAGLSYPGYKLEQVVVLSRHNIRSPLSSKDSTLGTLTPHEWFDWSSEPSELSLRGGVSETAMGQYFRKWMESEGLIPDNYMPGTDEVRIYANSKQRTIATAQYFSAGFLPVADVDVEYHAEFDAMDPVFNPQLTFTSDKYAKAADAQIHELFDPTIESLSSNYDLLSDVVDVQDSEAWKSGSFTGFNTNDTQIVLEEGAEPAMTGSLKTACSLSDALVLQYYEQPDINDASFGKALSYEQWKSISHIKDVYGDVLFTAPLIAGNVAHPLLQEIDAEMNNDARKFSFLCGHDSNVGSVLAALGVNEYELPATLEKTPIGCKLVFSKWSNEAGEEFWSVDLVYQTPEQLRDVSLLDLEEHPAVYNLRLPALAANDAGLYPAADVQKLFADAIAQYDIIRSQYAG